MTEPPKENWKSFLTDEETNKLSWKTILALRASEFFSKQSASTVMLMVLLVYSAYVAERIIPSQLESIREASIEREKRYQAERDIETARHEQERDRQLKEFTGQLDKHRELIREAIFNSNKPK